MASIHFIVALFVLPLISANQVDHCALTTIPKSTLTAVVHLPDFPFSQYETAYYYTGENKLFDRNFSISSSYNSFSLREWTVYKTELDGVFKIESNLILDRRNLRTANYSYVDLSNLLRVNLWLNGFWSESSGQLCMVGNTRNHDRDVVVLKLHGISNSTNYTSLITGTLESLNDNNNKDENHFEPMSVLIFPTKNYQYTLAGPEGCSGSNDDKGLLIGSLHRKAFCASAVFSVMEFNLKYANDCNSTKKCSPFDGVVGYLPSHMISRKIDCLEDEKKLRLMLQFRNGSMYNRFNLGLDFVTTLVGEGSWDEKNNQLCVSACVLLGITHDSLANIRVGECSTRLSLKIPAIWSIRDSSTASGQIWSNKAANESGYFKKITFQTSENVFPAQDVKYEYTVINKVEKLCPKKKPEKNNGETYPSGDSYDMKFDMWVKSSKKTAWGSANPFTVGNQTYDKQSHEMFFIDSVNSSYGTAPILENSNYNSSPVNISYRFAIIAETGLKHDGKPDGLFSLFNTSLKSNGQVEISAEGIYDGKSGSLCMIGCRKYGFNDLQIGSMDCEILVKLQFPSLHSKTNRGYIDGTIESTRKISDSLYFESLKVESVVYVVSEATRAVQRMGMEIIMVLISNTFACIFVMLQLFHVKKHPQELSGISVVMLVILTLGHMIPLMLNLEAMFLPNQNNNVLRSGGWLEVNEVFLRAVTMVAFLLKAYLLQLTWMSKSADQDSNDLWFFEKATVIASLPFYAVGTTIAWLVNISKSRNDVVMLSSRLMGKSVWMDLKSCGGLVLDFFLLPQILLNVFRSSKKSALSRSFYIGYTFIRLLPHVYDLYRSHSYNPDSDGSYYFAKPGADFYSTAWDIIIPLVCMLLAAIIYLQQLFGGRSIITRKFRQAYEMVPVATEESC